MIKIVLTWLVLLSTVLFTACPSKTIEKAKNASGRLATSANVGINVTRELFQSNVITLETKDKIADAFIVLAKAGIVFDSAVLKAEQTYGANAPKSEIERIFTLFDSTVVTQFLNVLQALKLVNDTSKFAVIIDTLRTSVLLIATVFGRGKQIEARLAL